MKNRISCARFAVLPLALAAAFPTLAQTQLNEVVVMATRFSQAADSLPFGVSVITADDIQRSGVSTVNEAIIKLLGVPGRVDFYGGGEYGLDLRGFGGAAASNQVVIVDGIKINEADLSGARMAGIVAGRLHTAIMFHSSQLEPVPYPPPPWHLSGQSWLGLQHYKCQ